MASAKEKAPLTIAKVATDAIMKGATNQEALDAVMKQFPDASTSLSSINWYRNRARTEHGKDRVKTMRELNKEARAKADKAAGTGPKGKAKGPKSKGPKGKAA